MAKSITIYGIKNCDTMKKARAWLDGKVCHIIASLKTFCEDGGFEIKNLMRGNDALPRPRLRAVIDHDLFHRTPGRIAPAELVEFADQQGSGVPTEIIELN